MNFIEEVLNKLSTSKFRSSFKLKEKEFKYIEKSGIDTLKEHAYFFVKQKLASKNIKNDGKQTPMKGHPVFIAQHATATCCRSCLYKWHHISKNKELTDFEIKYIVNVILFWILKQMNEKESKK